MFQKRHFEVIARVLGEMEAKRDLIEEFIQTFKNDNWKFDEHKFWKAIYKAADREFLLEDW